MLQNQEIIAPEINAAPVEQDREMREEEDTQLSFLNVEQTDCLSLPLSKPPDSEKSTQGSSSSHLSTGNAGTPFVLLESTEKDENPNMEVKN